jgi:hypothetical protein
MGADMVTFLEKHDHAPAQALVLGGMYKEKMSLEKKQG